MDICVKSLSQYGFVSCRHEVSGRQMEAQTLCSQCAELGNGSKVGPKNQLKRTGTAIIMLYICLTKRNVNYFDLQ